MIPGPALKARQRHPSRSERLPPNRACARWPRRFWRRMQARPPWSVPSSTESAAHTAATSGRLRSHGCSGIPSFPAHETVGPASSVPSPTCPSRSRSPGLPATRSTSAPGSPRRCDDPPQTKGSVVTGVCAERPAAEAITDEKLCAAGVEGLRERVTDSHSKQRAAYVALTFRRPFLARAASAVAHS
jgi:hypothetical protein